MEHKTHAIAVVQPNSEAINETRVKWTKPQLSPLGVADGTSGKVEPLANEATLISGTIGPGLS
jgi:hypothetical protein